MTARGTFEVKLTPAGDPEQEGAGRMSIAKVFQGDLEASSVGTMLAARGSVPGSAGYVAMERVTGALSGREGSFVLQHSGTMTRGVPEQNVTVAPDSGTDDLARLAGRMKITIAEGGHSYEFEYSLA